MKTKTFVLVHGGWHGGWCWKKVARGLRTLGHDVYTPTLTGLGERAHLLTSEIKLETGVEDLVGVLTAEELEEVVLVGHSAGAAAVLGTADRVPQQVSSVVLIDGVLLRNSESLRTHFTEPQEQAFQAAYKEGWTAFPPPPAAAFGVSAGLDADWVNRRLTPQPFGTAASALRLEHPVGNHLPCTYVACITPVHPFVEESHTIAKNLAGWDWRQIEAAHDAMITNPDAVVQTLLEVR